MRRVDCEGAEPIITQSAAGGRLPEHRALPVKPAKVLFALYIIDSPMSHMLLVFESTYISFGS